MRGFYGKKASYWSKWWEQQDRQEWADDDDVGNVGQRTHPYSSQERERKHLHSNWLSIGTPCGIYSSEVAPLELIFVACSSNYKYIVNWFFYFLSGKIFFLSCRVGGSACLGWPLLRISSANDLIKTFWRRGMDVTRWRKCDFDPCHDTASMKTTAPFYNDNLSRLISFFLWNPFYSSPFIDA